ncbi:MAG TPA: TonB family protein [Pyrinomonadaceae bacterium]|nr:TonB family protein [Pyrinomonadaceae bacterium]
MFTNLIESTSHAREFKRRGSFLLFTTATYMVLFVITGVVSIYAYDARLEQQNLEFVTMLSPQDFAPEPKPAPASQPDRPRPSNINESTIPQRAISMSRVDEPQAVPVTVSSTPNTSLPRPRGYYDVTGVDVEPSSGGRPGGSGSGAQVVTSRPSVIIEDPPPPPADPPKPKIIISKGPINGQALSLPKPVYPPIAKAAGIQGIVSVQVLIDENGRVVSAKAIDGSPTLRPEAQRAAMQARFSPTILGDQPVKVSGVITYNFILGR